MNEGSAYAGLLLGVSMSLFETRGAGFFVEKYEYTDEPEQKGELGDCETSLQTSVYKGYKQDKIEMRGDRAEMSDFPLYLNTVAGGLDRRDQTVGGFSFVVKIYTVPVVEIIG